MAKILPRWEKTAQLVSDSVQDEKLREKLQMGKSDEVREILYKYGFDDDEIHLIVDEDLPTLFENVRKRPGFWY
jgi:translation elongation factor EF-Tu-like GTPase